MKNRFGIFTALFLIAVMFYGFTFLPSKLHKPKIYDCFLFYNELELLELRFNELNDYVDKFVIVEACETFRGQPKPFFFQENLEKFKKYADKIIHIKLTEPYKTDNPWNRERYHREQIFQGLAGCYNNDIILLSDMDEVPRGACIPDVIEKISSKEYQAVVFGQKMYYGYLNRYQGGWTGTVSVNYKEAKRLTAHWVRKLRNRRPPTLRKAHISKICRIENAGWHFTAMGGIDRQIKKIESYSHAEFDTPEFKTKENLLKLVHSLDLQEIDDTYPQFIQDNQAYFTQAGFIDLSGIQGTSLGVSTEPIVEDE